LREKRRKRPSNSEILRGFPHRVKSTGIEILAMGKNGKSDSQEPARGGSLMASPLPCSLVVLREVDVGKLPWIVWLHEADRDVPKDL